MLLAGRGADDLRRRPLRDHPVLHPAAGRRDHRRHQPERQRGRPLPGDRAGGARRGGPPRPPHEHLRLVQPGRLLRHRGRIAGRRRPRPDCCRGAASPSSRATGPWSWATPSSGSAWWRSSLASRPRRSLRSRSACSTARPISTPNLGLSRSRGHVFKLAGLFSVDAFAGGLRGAGVRRLLVPLPLRRRAGHAGRHLLRRQRARRRLGAERDLAGSGGSACSRPWSRRTSPRTCSCCSCR